MPTDSGRPVRTCIGCKKRRAQADVVRVVRDETGRFQLGRTRPGRGAWLCAGDDPGQVILRDCLIRALASGGFQRAFKVRASQAEIVGYLGDELKSSQAHPTPDR